MTTIDEGEGQTTRQKPARIFRADALRRPRVERVARMGRRGSQAKVTGPLLRRFQGLVMPLAIKLFIHPEKESWLRA